MYPLSTPTLLLYRVFPLLDQSINPLNWCLRHWPIKFRAELQYLFKDGKRTWFCPQTLFQFISPIAVFSLYRKSFYTTDFGESHNCERLFSNISGLLLFFHYFECFLVLFVSLFFFFFFFSLQAIVGGKEKYLKYILS